MAESAVEAAHREEDALLWAGGELATCTDLQLLRQAKAWTHRREAGGQSEGHILLKVCPANWTAVSSKPEAPALPGDTWKPFC